MKLGIIVNMGIIDANGESQDNWVELDVSEDATPITRDRIKDYSDVGLIYTPYSREFRVPASKTNNKAFKHWYNPKMYEGFDPRKKYEAMLRVNGFDWRKGYVKLNGVDLKKNQPAYYRIQFLGEMTSLRETLGNTELSDLDDLDTLTHPYNIATVKDGMEAGLSISGETVTRDVDGDIKYPFISHSRGFEFDEQGFHRLLSDQEKAQVPAGLFEIGKKYKIHTVGTTSFTEIGAVNNNVGTEFIATGTGDGTGLAEYIVTGPDKLSHTDLKPAVRVNRILDAITYQFPSLVFNRDWLGKGMFNNLHLWMHSEKGSIRKQPTNNSPIPQTPVWWGGLGNNDASEWELTLTSGTEQRTTAGLRTLFQSSSSFQRYLDNTFTVTTPDSGNFSIRVKVVEKDINGSTIGTVLDETSQGVSGSASITFTLEYYLNIFKYYYVFFYVYSDDGIANFTPTIVLNKDANGSFGSDEVITYEGSAVSAVDSIIPTTQMPKMKVFDFLQNLFRMFNLVVYENRGLDGSFEIMVEPLNEWLSRGVTRDITKYVSIDESKVDRVNPFSNIRFGFPDPKTFLAINQRQTTNDDWGDLEVNISEFNEGISQSRFLFDGGEYAIDLAFEKMMYERLPNQDTNGLTKLQYGWAVNDNEENLPEPVLTRPLLLFIQNQDLDYGGDVFIETLDWDNGTISEVYNRPSNVYYGTENQTIHFNAEFDEYTAPDGGALVENSLYKTFYERFVSGVFSNRASRRHLTAYLPPEIFLNYKMNDKFIVDGVDYQIEEVETNHRSGKSKLSLIRMTDEDAVYDAIGYPIDSIVYYGAMENNADDSTNNHVPVATDVSYGSVSTPPPSGNYYADFGLSTAEIVVPHSPKLNFGDGTTDRPFSISFWLRYNDNTGTQNMVIKGKDIGTKREYRVWSSNNITWQLFDYSAGAQISLTVAKPPNNTWRFFTFTYDGSGSNTGMTAYANGVEATLARASTGVYTAMEDLGEDVTIGRDPGGLVSLDGDMDSVAFWDGELTPEEVEAVYEREAAGFELL